MMAGRSARASLAGLLAGIALLLVATLAIDLGSDLLRSRGFSEWAIAVHFTALAAPLSVIFAALVGGYLASRFSRDAWLPASVVVATVLIAPDLLLRLRYSIAAFPQ